VVAYTKFSQVFTTVLLLTVFTSVIPYMFSAAAQVFWLVTKGRPTSWGHFVKDLTISLVALAFIFWALAGAGAQAAYYGVFVFLLGVPLYVWLRASKKVPAVPASAGISAEADVVTATQLETHVQKHPELEPIT
jgi:APA family basic amino acid/polyamine antiporter